MNLPEYWPKLFLAEMIILFVSFFAVNLLVDFIGFVIPPSQTPSPYFPHIFEDRDPTNVIFVKRYWAEILFFLLVFFGQIAIFRQRKYIFTIKPRQNG